MAKPTPASKKKAKELNLADGRMADSTKAVKDPVDVTHGELNPTPEQEGDEKKENTESNVTAPSVSEPAFSVASQAAPSLDGRSMAVVAPKQ